MRNAKGNYSITITVMGERGSWADKSKTVYGSTGNVVAFKRLVVKE